MKLPVPMENVVVSREQQLEDSGPLKEGHLIDYKDGPKSISVPRNRFNICGDAQTDYTVALLRLLSHIRHGTTQPSFFFGRLHTTKSASHRY